MNLACENGKLDAVLYLSGALLQEIHADLSTQVAGRLADIEMGQDNQLGLIVGCAD